MTPQIELKSSASCALFPLPTSLALSMRLMGCWSLDVWWLVQRKLRLSHRSL